MCVKLNSALILFHYQYFPYGTVLGIKKRKKKKNHPAIIFTTTNRNKARLMSRKKTPVKSVFNVITEQSHVVTRWVLRWKPRILDIHVCVQVSVSGLTVSLRQTGPCGDFTAMIVIKRYLLNFNWRPLKRLWGWDSF